MDKKENKSTGVAKASAFTLDDVPNALASVIKQIKNIKGDSENGNRTTGELEGFGNIFKIKEPNTLIRAYSSINGREREFVAAAKEMGASKAKFTIGGSSAKAWKEDITRAYNIATAASKLKKLQAYKVELEKHLSEEHKLASLMGNLKDIMDTDED